MRKAVAKNDFDLAAEARDEIFGLELPEATAVLAANSAFYRAFSDRDADAMAEVWKRGA